MNKKGKLTLIIVCFAILGLIAGAVIKEYVAQEVAIIKNENMKQMYEQNAYMHLD